MPAWTGELIGGPFDGDVDMLKPGVAPPHTLHVRWELSSPGCIAWLLNPKGDTVPYQLSKADLTRMTATYVCGGSDLDVYDEATARDREPVAA